MAHTDPLSSVDFPDSESLWLCHKVVQETSRSLRHNQNKIFATLDAAQLGTRNIGCWNMAVMLETVQVTFCTVTAKVRQDKI